MGKGGQQLLKQEKKSSVESSRLSHLHTEELKKWAKQYGENSDASRETLLALLEPYAGGILDPYRPKNNLPLEKPKFTLNSIRNAIPRHCFERNLWTSLKHLFSDLMTIAVIGYAATWIGHTSLPSWSSYVLWPIYWYAQGSVMTGVWVLAHECGHQSFSESWVINNTIGTICHSMLLVPYHSWRITHGRHHSNTGSCENDEVFAPATRSDLGEAVRESPLANAIGIILMLTVGWMPGYLLLNATGPKKYHGKNANHFSPTAVFFNENEYGLVVQSDIGFGVGLALLAACIYTFGFSTVAFYYLLPYMITNYHLVLITYLQHTDVYMPHFRQGEWNNLHGALCTVDRSFGPLLDYTFHHISDTHVCHHLFSKIPFYHAQEATEAIKAHIGEYYLKDDTPIARATWRAFSNCLFIEDDAKVVFYKSKL